MGEIRGKLEQSYILAQIFLGIKTRNGSIFFPSFF